MKTIDIIRVALDRRAAPDAANDVGTPEWWTSLVDELKVGGAELIRRRQLAQFAARFTGQAILVDAQSANGRRIASFELRMEQGTRKVACLPLNDPAMRQMPVAS